MNYELNLKPLMLLGGGGHCKAVIDAIKGSGRHIKGVLDVPEKVGQEILGVPIVGTDEDVARYVNDCDFVVTLGSAGRQASTARRAALHRRVEEAGGQLATVVAATAYVSPFAEIGEGTVVLHHATVNAGATVGRSCIVNTGADVEHDVTVGDFTHISTGSLVNGGCRVGSRAFVGSGAVTVQGVTVGDDVTVGAGAVVNRDLTEPGTYAGVPARPITSNKK